MKLSATAFLILILTFHFRLSAIKLSPCDSFPDLNKKVVAFVKTQINKKVGKGECWDLAAAALNQVKANWDKNYQFGRHLKKSLDCIYPGDIIQFEGVKLQYEIKGTVYTEELEHHTAVIYQVHDQVTFVLAEQNTSTGGKKVVLNPFALKTIKEGSFKIFRPVK